jgi:hypothetical protein
MQHNNSIDTDALSQPALLITIDTEGDNLWARPKQVATENARYLPRFQALCEKHGLRPTWLVNYEMAECPAFVEFGRDIVERDAGEIGMHLHAWNSPPPAPLTNNDVRHQPYLIEYPHAVMREKIGFMTDLLEERFQRKMISHRAGRWGFSAVYARLLVERGYQVDCSVTPHISWAGYLGNPHGLGGPDFRGFPELPYFVDLKMIGRPGDSPLLEVPVSVIKTRYACFDKWVQVMPRIVQRIWRRLLPPILTMVPRDNQRNLGQMLTIMNHALENRRPCVELAIHSSELMPGGSPFFRNLNAIERLYERLEILFSTAAESFRGSTLSEFRDEIGDCDLEIVTRDQSYSAPRTQPS